MRLSQWQAIATRAAAELEGPGVQSKELVADGEVDGFNRVVVLRAKDDAPRADINDRDGVGGIHGMHRNDPGAEGGREEVGQLMLRHEAKERTRQALLSVFS